MVISRNYACFNGGGIYFEKCKNPYLKYVTVRENESGLDGDGINCYKTNIYIENSTIIKNITLGGHAIHFTFSELSMVNTTVVGHDEIVLYCYSSKINLFNTILWNNSSREITAYQPSKYPLCVITIAFSDIRGGKTYINDYYATLNWMEGNIDEDPIFINIENDDLRLKEGSPCIDSGTAFYMVGDSTLIDISQDKYIGSSPDMGAYEYNESTTVFLKDNNNIPEDFILHQNYPNPFNPVTTISFSLPEQQHLTLKIYNITGKEVKTLIDDKFSAGTHSVEWDASEFSSGLYFYRIKSGNFVDTKKMLLMK